MADESQVGRTPAERPAAKSVPDGGVRDETAPGDRAPGDRPAGRRKRRFTGRDARLLTTGAFLLAVAAGYFLHIGIGNACGIGFLDVALVCPLGSLSALVASKTAIPRALVSLACFAALVLLLGRAFCGWLCPVPVLQRWFPGVNRGREERARRRREKLAKKQAWERKLALEEAREQGRTLSEEELGEIVAKRMGARAEKSGGRRGGATRPTCPTGCGRAANAGAEGEPARGASEEGAGSEGAAGGPRRRSAVFRFRSPHAILLATLATTAVFGFPVFCTVCPVGLTFAFVLLVMRLFVYGELTWALVAFPAVVLAEVALLPRWCRDICPLGALHSLVAAGNRTFRPHVDEATCLHAAKGPGSCDRCTRACPQGIDLHDVALGRTALNECLKCRACSDVCPTRSITFPFVAPRGPQGPAAPVAPAGEGAAPASRP